MPNLELIKNLKIRTISAIVLFLVVLGAVFYSPYTLLGLLVLICILGMLEFFKLAQLTGAKPQEKWATVIGALCVLLAFFAKLNKVPWELVAGLIPALSMLFVLEIYRKTNTPFANIAWSVLGVFYIALPLALLAYIPVQPAVGGYLVYRPMMVFSILCIIWANDVGAYLVGIALGRHPLFPRISPKKTWEGFFGGKISAILVGVWMSHLQGAPLWLWGGAAGVIVLSGVYGDLVESMFKRSLGIKDSGDIIPGHGGILDRFDALLLCLPFVFVYLLLFS